MSQSTGSNPSDTLEFLAIMGASPAPAAPAARAGEPDPFDDDQFLAALTGSVPSRRSVPAAPAEPAPHAQARPAPQPPARRDAVAASGSKPVVIKGGPRRVVRADGRQPDMAHPMGQRRFALSSGRAMFAPKKPRNKLRDSVIALVAMLLALAVFAGVWFSAQASLTEEAQRDLVGTTQYDSSLSLTPANDGGYYTVFFVTSTPTTEEQIGTLSQVVMYRTDKELTSAIRIDVPSNLYVKPSSSDSQAHTVAQLLQEAQSITRALNGIDNELGIRLYNVVCCGQDVYNAYAGLLAGGAPSSLDAESYLGQVRSNLSLAGIVEFCSKVGAIDQSTVASFTVPTTTLDVQGVPMAQTTPDTYNASLVGVLSKPANVKYDERGNYAGTTYDEAGNPQLDENGVPWGALRDPDTGELVFDENGYLQFYGQQYDANGWPVGTKYDEAGNPILDQWGNPMGTQYNWDGSDYIYDWRGNIVIL